MTRTQIYLPQKLNTELKLIARQKDQSMAAVIRRMLMKQLDAEQEQRKGSSARVLLRIAGMGGKGPRDLSKNIDEYLYGKKSFKYNE